MHHTPPHPAHDGYTDTTPLLTTSPSTSRHSALYRDHLPSTTAPPSAPQSSTSKQKRSWRDKLGPNEADIHIATSWLHANSQHHPQVQLRRHHRSKSPTYICADVNTGMFYPRFQNQIYKVDPARRQAEDPLPMKEGGVGYVEVESKLGERKVAAGRGESKGDGLNTLEITDVPEWQEGGVVGRDGEIGVDQSRGRRKSVKEKVKGVFGRKKDGEGDVVR